MNFKISLSARELIFTMVSRVLRQYFKLYIILYENFVYAVSYAFHYAAVYVSMKMDFEIIQVCSDLYQFFAGFSFESTLSIASCNTRCSTFHLEINIPFAPAFLSIVNIDVISHKFLTYVCIESTKILFKILIKNGRIPLPNPSTEQTTLHSSTKSATGETITPLGSQKVVVSK